MGQDFAAVLRKIRRQAPAPCLVAICRKSRASLDYWWPDWNTPAHKMTWHICGWRC